MFPLRSCSRTVHLDARKISSFLIKPWSDRSVPGITEHNDSQVVELNLLFASQHEPSTNVRVIPNIPVTHDVSFVSTASQTIIKVRCPNSLRSASGLLTHMTIPPILRILEEWHFETYYLMNICARFSIKELYGCVPSLLKYTKCYDSFENSKLVAKVFVSSYTAREQLCVYARRTRYFCTQDLRQCTFIM